MLPGRLAPKKATLMRRSGTHSLVTFSNFVSAGLFGRNSRIVRTLARLVADLIGKDIRVLACNLDQLVDRVLTKHEQLLMIQQLKE